MFLIFLNILTFSSLLEYLNYVVILFYYARWKDLRKLTKVFPYGDNVCSTDLPRYLLLISPA